MRSLLGYLVLDQPRQRYTHWVEALAPLVAPGAPPPLQVDAYFVAAEDRALLALWYLAGDTDATALVAEVTRLAEIYVIDPACMAEPDRRVLLERLAECEVVVDRRTSIVDALGELVRCAREQRQVPAEPSSRTITGRRAGGQGTPPASMPALSATESGTGFLGAGSAGGASSPGGPMARDSSSMLAGSSGMHSTAFERAETYALHPQGGEREGAPRLGRPAGTRNDIPPLAAGSSFLPQARRPSEVRTSPFSSPALSPMPPGMPGMSGMPGTPASRPGSGGGASAGGGGGGLSVSAVSAGPAANVRQSRAVRARTEATTDPFLLAFQAVTPAFSAHYLRGQRWLPAQLSHLSLEGAQLAAVSLPRAGDAVHLALGFGELTVAVRAEVSHVADEAEAQVVGAAFFQVKFALDDVVREQLYGLLLRARSANAQLLPPPPRASRRTAVTWPLMLATPRGSIRAEMLDVSELGLFVHPLRELELEGNIGFSMVLDDQVTSISGRVQVVRHLPAAEAKQRGLRAGYGVELTDLAGSHRQPWERFVARVRRRAARRVLVGAPAARFDELAGGLAAVGYAVIGAIEPASAAQLAEAERRPPDAAVMDGEWMAAGAQASWLESILTARGVRCLTCHGDPRRAYGELDRLLGVTGVA